MVETRPEDIQILLVEMQEPVITSSVTCSPARLRRAAAHLCDVAAAASLPITASVVALGAGPPQLVGELRDLEPLVRTTVSVFGDAALASRLRSHRRRVLAVGGVSSEIAVLHAVLGARAAGYEVHVLTDLCGGLDARTEAAAFARMWQVGAIPSNLSSFLTGFIGSMSGELGAKVMQTLGDYWGWHADGASVSERGDEAEDGAVALLAELRAAWREGDARRFAAPFARDARFVAFDGSVLLGRDAIAEYHVTPFATHLANTELRFGPLDVRVLPGPIRIVATEGGIVRAGETEGERIGRSAQTFVIDGAAQRILAFQNTRVRPIDGPAAAEVWRKFDASWAELR